MDASASRHKAAVVLCMGFMLSACGGGGGGDSGGGGGDSGDGSGNQGQFSISPASLTFAATSSNSASMPPLRITGTISGASPQTLYLNAQVTGYAVRSVEDIVVTGPTMGTANVYVLPPRDLGPGSYSSVITVTACTTSVACTAGVIGTPQTVNVTYTIDGVRSSPATLVYEIGDTATTRDLAHTFDVTGYPVQNWTASASVPWLTVDPASGNTGATIRATARLAPDLLELYASSSVLYARIDLIPSAGAAISLPVIVNIGSVRVNEVAPYVALSGTENDVIIRGSNLTEYPITGVRFGATNAVSYTVVSDTEIRARHAALAAGSYEVNIVNGQAPRTRAALRVVDPRNYSFTALDYSSSAANAAVCMVHDPERDSLLVGARPTTGPTQLLRYSLAAGGSVAAAASFPAMNACVLTADGRRVIVDSYEIGGENGAFALLELDPVTLTQEKRAALAGSVTEASGMASANNGRILFSMGTVLSYSPHSYPAFESFTSSHGTTSGKMAASRDGSILLVGNSEGIMKYDASSHQLSRLWSPVAAQVIELDRTGERALFDSRRVYARDFQLLGSLPSTIRAAALSPSSRRAYGYDQNGSVRIFDVSAASSGSFTEILPAISLAQSPGTPTSYQMLVSHDERGLFIAGSARALVIPLP